MAGYTLLDDAPTPSGGYTLLDDVAPKKAQFSLKSEGYDKAMNYSGRDAIGGQIRGAGSIGASLIRMLPSFLGGDNEKENADRRTAMDSGLTSLIGSNPEATAYQTNKLIAEVSGTSGIGGAVGGVLSKIPGATKAIPSLIAAIKSSGMTAGGATGAYGTAARVAGGAVTGAATSAAVDPENATTGALIGGVLPPAVQLAGQAGVKLGNAYAQKLADQLKEFSRNSPKNETVKQSLDAGYVIPPNMVKPSFTNQVIESISGKQATQQIFSAKNEKVTGDLVRKALGVADDAPLTQSTLESLRKTAGKDYANVSALSPQAAVDLEALKQARNDSQGWFKSYNRSASPDDLAKAKAFKATADGLETSLEAHATGANQPELVTALREARKQIAKTYTVSRAVNDASGTVDSRVLGRMYEKGMPLSDGLDIAGKFGSAFPTISKSQQQVGSPAAHNLKALFSAGFGAGGVASLGPLGAAAAAVPFVTPPLARALMLRSGAQQSLIQQTPTMARNAQLAQMLTDPGMNQLLLRTAPAIASQAQR